MENRPLTVFAAAGATDVIRVLAERYEARSGVSTRTSFAASSTLARQLESGARADVYLCAHPRWMDYLSERGLIPPSSRFDLLGNRLVLIAPRDRPFTALAQPDFDLAGAFSGKLALADPDHVPAGLYAKEALEALGWWSALRARVVPALDVRAAAWLVELGEADAGVVYRTDALLSDKVVTVLEFPERLHAPIRHSIALCADASPGAADFVRFLRGEEAKEAFERAGFQVIDRN